MAETLTWAQHARQAFAEAEQRRERDRIAAEEDRAKKAKKAADDRFEEIAAPEVRRRLGLDAKTKFKILAHNGDFTYFAPQDESVYLRASFERATTPGNPVTLKFLRIAWPTTDGGWTGATGPEGEITDWESMGKALREFESYLPRDQRPGAPRRNDT